MRVDVLSIDRLLAHPLLRLQYIERMEHGINDPWLIEDQEGRQWIRKDVEPGALSAQGLLGECLAWLIGRRVGVPIPNAAIWYGPAGERAWLSRYIERAALWRPHRRGQVADWREAGAIWPRWERKR